MGCEKYLVAVAMASAAAPAWGAPADSVQTLRAELAIAKAQIADQQKMLDAQERRLRVLEERWGPVAAAPASVARPTGEALAAAQSQSQAPIERVGQAAPSSDRPPEVAVLGTVGSVVTRKGQLTAEFGAEYARADRNQAIFRGIELIESVLVGVFNISESRQDIMTLAGSLRYGVTNNAEIGVRVPFVHRSNNLISAPIGQANQSETSTSAQGTGLGDIELSARYQIASARNGWPYLIGNIQVVAPTGSSPFNVPRRPTGEELKAATGSGFWGVSPSLTAILPTDPAVLFGTIGYTKNFGRSFNMPIGAVIVDYVRPGDAISFSGGIGISLNQRTSLNLGYAHNWSFGTKTITRPLVPSNNPGANEPSKRTSRDLQLGRFLFGVTYRVNDRASVNWAVEVGATQDATDMRTTLRVPLVLLTGG